MQQPTEKPALDVHVHFCGFSQHYFHYFTLFFFPFHLNQKEHSVSMDLKRPSYKRTVRWTMQGLTEPFQNIAGYCNFTEAKSREVCTVLLDKGLFLKNRMTLPIEHFVWPSRRLKTINLD